MVCSGRRCQRALLEEKPLERQTCISCGLRMTNPFRYFKISPEIIRLAVMRYVRFPLSPRNVENLQDERGIDITYETVRFWWNRFGLMFAREIRKRRVQNQNYSNWSWHLDEVFVRVNGKLHYLWRAVDLEGEVLEASVSKRRDHKATLKFLRKLMKRYGSPKTIVTDKLGSYRAAMKVIGNADIQDAKKWGNNHAKKLASTIPITNDIWNTVRSSRSCDLKLWLSGTNSRHEFCSILIELQQKTLV